MFLFDLFVKKMHPRSVMTNHDAKMDAYTAAIRRVCAALSGTVDVNSGPPNRRPPLYKAIELRRPDFVRKLLSLGANRNDECRAGMSPAITTITHELPGIFGILLYSPGQDLKLEYARADTLKIQSLEAFARHGRGNPVIYTLLHDNNCREHFAQLYSTLMPVLLSLEQSLRVEANMPQPDDSHFCLEPHITPKLEVLIRIGGTCQRSLGSLLADAFARANSTGIRLTPEDTYRRGDGIDNVWPPRQFPFKLPTTMEVHFDEYKFDAAKLTNLLTTRIDSNGPTAFSEACRESEKLTLGVRDTIVYPSLTAKDGFSIITRNRHIAAAARQPKMNVNRLVADYSIMWSVNAEPVAPLLIETPDLAVCKNILDQGRHLSIKGFLFDRL